MTGREPFSTTLPGLIRSPKHPSFADKWLIESRLNLIGSNVTGK